MSEVDRRRFLQAFVTGVDDSDGQIILKASPEQVLAFGVHPGAAIVVIPPIQLWRNFPDYNLLPAFKMMGTLLYNQQGRPVATVTKFQAIHPDWETEPWDAAGDGTVPHKEKIQIHICAEGLPELIG